MLHIFHSIISIFLLLFVLFAFLSRAMSVIKIFFIVFIVLVITGSLNFSGLYDVFANKGPITIICLFIITAGLKYSGLMYQISRFILFLSSIHKMLSIIVCLLVVFAMSAFINNTPIVFVMTPILGSLALMHNISLQRLLIPLSYISILGGMMTIMGTSTNIIANDIAFSLINDKFSLFGLTKPAICVALVGMIYLLIVVPIILPNKKITILKKIEYVKFSFKKVLIAIFSLLFVIVGSFLNFDMAILSFISALFILFSGIIPKIKIVETIEWPLIALIYTMLAISISIVNLGLIDNFVDIIYPLIENKDPILVFAIIFLLSVIMTEILTNNAVAIFLTPVAIQLAISLNIDPLYFVAAVMFGASASFITPLGYQTNTYVFTLGEYHFAEFIRIGFPLSVLTGITTISYASIFWF